MFLREESGLLERLVYQGKSLFGLVPLFQFDYTDFPNVDLRFTKGEVSPPHLVFPQLLKSGGQSKSSSRKTRAKSIERQSSRHNSGSRVSAHRRHPKRIDSDRRNRC